MTGGDIHMVKLGGRSDETAMPRSRDASGCNHRAHSHCRADNAGARRDYGRRCTAPSVDPVSRNSLARARMRPIRYVIRKSINSIGISRHGFTK